MKAQKNPHLSEEQQEQLRKKNARVTGEYSSIWQNTGKCVFCDLKDKYILYEENGIVLTVNIYPYIDGQLMAIPRKHIQSPKELTPSEWQTIRKFNYIAKKIQKKLFGHKALWTLIREGGERAQMTVSDHLHVQFIPFDSPDLCKWNYRELQHTPLESAGIFKSKINEIKKFSKRFGERYGGDC